MTALNICVDIDGTITTPYYWIKDVNKYFHKNVKPTDVIEYEIHKVLNVPREEYLRFYNLYGEEIHYRAKARNRAKRILSILSQKHRIYYITAREERMTEITERWLKKRKFPIDGLYVLGSHYKVDKARELNCDIFIEDRYENAIELAKAGFKVLLIDCYYNRMPLIQGVTRVYNWDEIYHEIMCCYELKCKLEVA